MSQSLACILVHVVFSTKDRTPILNELVRPALHAYLAVVARDAGCECFRAGGVADHVHLSLRMDGRGGTAEEGQTGCLLTV